MSCPTCDHAMVNVEARIFWCPRCGTIKDDREVVGDVPKLVDRVRQMVDLLREHPAWTDAIRASWHRLGILESIHLPGDRQ